MVPHADSADFAPGGLIGHHRRMSDEPGHTRIGTAERESAMRALDVHLEAGRLDAEEYGERAGRISVARTAGELNAPFVDLPEPRPTSTGAIALAGPSSRLPARRPDRTGRVALGGRIGEIAVGVSPFVALVLFFVFEPHFPNAWIFFLLIPATGAVVYGRGPHDHDHRDRDRRRRDS